LDSFTEHAALVALLRTRPGNLTWRKLTEQVVARRSAVEVWRKYHPDGLLPVSTERASLAEAETDLRTWNRTGLRFLSAIDVSFPPSLLGTVNTPPFLFAQGNLKDHDPAIAVVGSRNPSVRGAQLATAIAEYLVAQSLTVVSGLAAGIDAAAHETALRNGGRTVAFIATGITKSYPAANRQTQQAIGERGLLLSQFWPEAPPQKANFLIRNSSIAQYASAAIVVEAGEHSGARNLARQAVELGRPLILTDLVTDTNEWAQQLVSTSGVYRAASLTELAEIIQQIVPGEHREPDAGDAK
jgi:DNA processing protein